MLCRSCGESLFRTTITEGKDLCLPELGFVETGKGLVNFPKFHFQYWECSVVSHSKSQCGAYGLCPMVGLVGTEPFLGSGKGAMGGGRGTEEFRQAPWFPSWLKPWGWGLYIPEGTGLETPEHMGAHCCHLGGEAEPSLEGGLHHRERS